MLSQNRCEAVSTSADYPLQYKKSITQQQVADTLGKNWQSICKITVQLQNKITPECAVRHYITSHGVPCRTIEEQVFRGRIMVVGAFLRLLKRQGRVEGRGWGNDSEWRILFERK